MKSEADDELKAERRKEHERNGTCNEIRVVIADSQQPVKNAKRKRKEKLKQRDQEKVRFRETIVFQTSFAMQKAKRLAKAAEASGLNLIHADAEGQAMKFWE